MRVAPSPIMSIDESMKAKLRKELRSQPARANPPRITPCARASPPHPSPGWPPSSRARGWRSICPSIARRTPRRCSSPLRRRRRSHLRSGRRRAGAIAGMRFYPLAGKTRRGVFGISVPHGAARRRTVAPRWLDLIVVPLVGIDGRGRRLGMGGGFYDRALAFRRNRASLARASPGRPRLRVPARRSGVCASARRPSGRGGHRARHPIFRHRQSPPATETPP